jgi:hypothetical protein
LANISQDGISHPVFPGFSRPGKYSFNWVKWEIMGNIPVLFQIMEILYNLFVVSISYCRTTSYVALIDFMQFLHCKMLVIDVMHSHSLRNQMKRRVFFHFL